MAFNGAIDWGSKLVKVTMHSSSEIEIAAACLAAKRLQFYRELCREIKIRVKTPFPMLIDNSGAIDLCEKVGASKRTEHFQRWQHYCRYMTRHCITKLHFVRTHEQLADQLTKMGDKTSFLRTRAVVLNLKKADDTIEAKEAGSTS